MGIKTYKPTTPSRRYMTGSDFADITKKEPEKSLLTPKKRLSGRDSYGHITVRRRGGGHKRRYRIVDFKRDKRGIPATVAAVEYYPNRTCRLALLHYADGEKRYILCPDGVKVGQKLMGMVARIMAREGGFAHIKLPSGEVRMVNVKCYATVGQVGHLDHENISLGKAGRKRWLGIRPTVRGVAMNPIDHPMGGGEGRSSGGGHPVSPWGKLTKGKKTRKRRQPTGKFILQRRT
jgi:large subunit ribosomal protein L2